LSTRSCRVTPVNPLTIRSQHFSSTRSQQPPVTQLAMPLVDLFSSICACLTHYQRRWSTRSRPRQPALDAFDQPRSRHFVLFDPLPLTHTRTHTRCGIISAVTGTGQPAGPVSRQPAGAGPHAMLSTGASAPRARLTAGVCTVCLISPPFSSRAASPAPIIHHSLIFCGRAASRGASLISWLLRSLRPSLVLSPVSCAASRLVVLVMPVRPVCSSRGVSLLPSRIADLSPSLGPGLYRMVTA
jgi:hypothetical protein